MANYGVIIKMGQFNRNTDYGLFLIKFCIISYLVFLVYLDMFSWQDDTILLWTNTELSGGQWWCCGCMDIFGVFIGYANYQVIEEVTCGSLFIPRVFILQPLRCRNFNRNGTWIPYLISIKWDKRECVRWINW